MSWWTPAGHCFCCTSCKFGKWCDCSPDSKAANDACCFVFVQKGHKASRLPACSDRGHHFSTNFLCWCWLLFMCSFLPAAVKSNFCCTMLIIQYSIWTSNIKVEGICFSPQWLALARQNPVQSRGSNSAQSDVFVIFYSQSIAKCFVLLRLDFLSPQFLSNKVIETDP